MSNQPIIFNIQYTPYSLPKNVERILRGYSGTGIIG